MKQIKITDEFLRLDKETTKCQNEETYDDCVTKQYIVSLTQECECLPFSIAQTDKVNSAILSSNLTNLF